MKTDEQIIKEVMHWLKYEVDNALTEDIIKKALSIQRQSFSLEKKALEKKLKKDTLQLAIKLGYFTPESGMFKFYGIE